MEVKGPWVGICPRVGPGFVVNSLMKFEVGLLPVDGFPPDPRRYLFLFCFGLVSRSIGPNLSSCDNSSLFLPEDDRYVWTLYSEKGKDYGVSSHCCGCVPVGRIQSGSIFFP